MTVDPDGCSFWYTQEYYETTGLNWQTRIGSLKFPSCTTTLPPRIVPADFNGDGKTDISVYRPVEHRWYSANG